MKSALLISVAVLLCTLCGIEGELVKERRSGNKKPSGNKEPPAMPGLVRLERGNKFQCVGTLIDEQWIVTSASCVVRGRVNMVVMEGKKKMAVDRIITHHDWDGKAHNNIALVLIKGRAQGVSQMNMANRQREQRAADVKSRCYSMDWNKRKGMTGQVSAVRWLTCGRQLSGFNIEDPICSVIKQDCKGPEGNPTICMIGNGAYLVGIEAVEKEAGGRCYNGLTRVSRYLPWFRNVMDSVDKTDVPTGGRCMPRTDGRNPCLDSYADCMPEVFSHRCQCIEMYQEQNGECQYIGGFLLGRKCTAENTCSIPNAECAENNTVCACTENHQDQDGVCEYMEGDVGRKCTADDTCFDPNAECDADKTCTCKFYYTPIDGTCEVDIRHTINEGCIEDSDCIDGLVCFTDFRKKRRECRCKVGYIFEEETDPGYCEKCPDGESSAFYDSCDPKHSKHESCQTSVPFDWTCEDGLVCVPPINSTANPTEFLCVCPRTSKNDNDCTPCPENQQRSGDDGDVCVEMVGLGEDCTDNGQCGIFSTCDGSTSTCRCITGYIPNENVETCVYVQINPDREAECENNDQCSNRKLLECSSDGNCVCAGGRNTNKGECWDACVDPSQATCRSSGNGRYGCFTLCDGNTECTSYLSDIGDDEKCGLDYASFCISSLQCNSTMGLLCSDFGQCECGGPGVWSWSDLSCSNA